MMRTGEAKQYGGLKEHAHIVLIFVINLSNAIYMFHNTSFFRKKELCKLMFSSVYGNSILMILSVHQHFKIMCQRSMGKGDTQDVTSFSEPGNS